MEPVSRIDCGFRNLSSLGLLSGFQRPSRLCRLSCCATVLLDLTAFNQRGGRFILNRFRCQAAVAASLFRFTAKESCFSLSRGRGTYCRSALRVNSLRRLVFSGPSLVCHLRDIFASEEAASTTTAFRVNLASSTSYFALFAASAGGSHRQCGFAFPSEGARLLSLRPG